MRQIVIGRVFEDRNGNGQFDAGERAVAGARIYANNGQSVITDSAGQYNIPSVSQGSIVLSLDPVTLPDGYELRDDAVADRQKAGHACCTRRWEGVRCCVRILRSLRPKPNLPCSDEVKVIVAKGAFIPDPKTATNAAIAGNSTKARIQIASLNNKLPLNLPPAQLPENGKTSETFTAEASEKIEPVAAGNLIVLSPNTDDVIMSPALTIKVRVAITWFVDAQVNGVKMEDSIGETRVDNRNQVTTYSIVGINLRPGENIVKLSAIGPNGEGGTTTELRLFGRGPVEKLEIIPSKTDAQTGGRDAVKIEIRGFDHWGNPASDGQISIETSAGKIFAGRSSNDTPDGEADLARQQMVSLKNGTATVQLIADGTADVARLKAIAGQQEATADVRFTAEMRRHCWLVWPKHRLAGLRRRSRRPVTT